jgi:hypothetical protein
MRRAVGGFLGVTAAALLLLGAVGLRPAGAEGELDPATLAGEWKLAGWNIGADRAGKPSYTGSVSLTHRGNGTFEVGWTVGGKQVNTGIGLWDGRTGVFASGYAIQGQPGVAVFRLSEGGKVLDCVGTFKGKIGEIAWEEWRRE